MYNRALPRYALSFWGCSCYKMGARAPPRYKAFVQCIPTSFVFTFILRFILIHILILIFILIFILILISY